MIMMMLMMKMMMMMMCCQLPYHPGHDDLVTHIISLAFRHFKYREMLVGDLLSVLYILYTYRQSIQVVLPCLYKETCGGMAAATYGVSCGWALCQITSLSAEHRNNHLPLHTGKSNWELCYTAAVGHSHSHTSKTHCHSSCHMQILVIGVVSAVDLAHVILTLSLSAWDLDDHYR